MSKANKLRKKYPQFKYSDYSYQLKGKDLKITFDFSIGSEIFFKPEIAIKDAGLRLKKINREVLNNLVFNLGLIESLSYWKATCSPEILVSAGKLSEDQIIWWRNLISFGFGQFFFENKIDWRKKGFLEIKSFDNKKVKVFSGKLRNNTLVPIGGGKDSAVTIELLKAKKKKINCFSLNPILPAKKIMKIGKCKNPLIVKRKIDKKLLELNRKGFLNGHTPFSAYLAFLSVLLAVLFDYRYLAFSNERSSNEGNVKYLGHIINHQYSKSFDFEKKFRYYSKSYLAKKIEYFSYLRPLYEIQIAKIFSQYPQYFTSFLSCNEAFKTDSGRKKKNGKWCCNCSKCLFAFAILYPFLSKKDILKIFKENLFEKKELIPVMEQLIGVKKFKPFECVGTKEESLVAFYLSFLKNKDGLPIVLNYFKDKVLPKYPDIERVAKKMMSSWNSEHFLPRDL